MHPSEHHLPIDLASYGSKDCQTAACVGSKLSMEISDLLGPGLPASKCMSQDLGRGGPMTQSCTVVTTKCTVIDLYVVHYFLCVQNCCL